MKTIALTLALSFAALAQQPAPHTAITAAVRQKVVTYIAQQAKTNSEPGSPPAAAGDEPTILMPDINHDGIPDLVTLYSIEGEHGYMYFHEYLAVWLGSKMNASPLKWMIGGKLAAALEHLLIRQGVIYLDGPFWLPEDAGCCPTGNLDLRLVLEEGKLAVAFEAYQQDSDLEMRHWRAATWYLDKEVQQ
jgi:hypothetical protein